MEKKMIEAGKEYMVACPFIRTTYDQFDGEASVEIESWKPGYYSERDHEGELSASICKDEGIMVIVVLAIVPMPAPLHSRVIYYRNWIDPDGKRFGRKNIKMIGINGMKSMVRRWRYSYEINSEKADEHFEEARIPF